MSSVTVHVDSVKLFLNSGQLC